MSQWAAGFGGAPAGTPSKLGKRLVSPSPKRKLSQQSARPFSAGSESCDATMRVRCVVRGAARQGVHRC